MRIGDLNKRIVLQYQTKTPDGMGGFVVAWVDACTIWAGIWPISANETIQAGATTMIATHRIRIRYRTILKPYWRVKFGTRYFTINSIINPSEKNEILDLLCKEAV